jgi:hypothetical protein
LTPRAVSDTLNPVQLTMRADLQKKPEETEINWLRRLHQIALSTGNVESADREAVAIILNHLPPLLDNLERLEADEAEQDTMRLHRT